MPAFISASSGNPSDFQTFLSLSTVTDQQPDYLRTRLADSPDQQASAMHNYYKLHALIYDWTRWTFLFGRNRLLKMLPFQSSDAPVILEVGCGTGHNIKKLAALYPSAQLIGLDVSSDMLRQAQKQVRQLVVPPKLLNRPYSPDDETFKGQVDAILFSYSLTMINPQWEALIRKAYEDLKPGGIIGVVDFHDSPFQWFKTHMANNHVKMEGHLLPVLQSLFCELRQTIGNGYFGIWNYLVFIGRKPE